MSNMKKGLIYLGMILFYGMILKFCPWDWVKVLIGAFVIDAVAFDSLKLFSDNPEQRDHNE